MCLRLALPVFAAMLIACSSGSPDNVDQGAATPGIERIVEEVAVNSGVPVSIADLSIDGMSCEMMCGGSIKKALAKLPGVNSTEIRFVEGDENDHAVVSYDAARVTDDEMIRTIQSLYDGQYKVVSVKITKQVPATNGTSTGNTKAEDRGVSLMAPAALVVPGIVSILAQLLRL